MGRNPLALYKRDRIEPHPRTKGKRPQNKRQAEQRRKEQEAEAADPDFARLDGDAADHTERTDRAEDEAQPVAKKAFRAMAMKDRAFAALTAKDFASDSRMDTEAEAEAEAAAEAEAGGDSA